MIRPTTRGWSVLALASALLGAGWWWRYPGLVALGAGFGALVALAVMSIALPLRVRAVRSVSALEVPRNGRCVSKVEIVHAGRWWSTWVSVDETVGAAPVAVLTARLRPGGPATGEIAVPTSRRGTLPLGPLRLRRMDPLGLAARVELAAGVTAVRVLPRVLPVTELPVGEARWIAGSDERVEHGGTDLVGMRDYLPGDDLRRLHWATSARLGRLMVREDADPSHGRITLLLDDLAPNHDGDSFEEAVDVAASLAFAVGESGHPVRLRSASGRLSADRADGEEVLALLGEATVAPVARADRAESHDVLVVVGGADSDVDGLVLGAGHAVLALALVVSGSPLTARVPVVHGSAAEELLRGWEELVSE